ncbi:MAG: hypothetical protein F3743_01710 [Nitrospinae bacterium]|nr:hypothetical protein [Nitrospinota bacterium]MZH13626.1 hypothetical protein [Nitrospinota bacterium]
MPRKVRTGIVNPNIGGGIQWSRENDLGEIDLVDNFVEWARCNQIEFYRMRVRLMPREIDADVNAGTSFFECLREIEELQTTEKAIWLEIEDGLRFTLQTQSKPIKLFNTNTAK